MFKEKLVNSIDAALSIQKAIEFLRETVSFMQEGEGKNAHQNLNHATSLVKHLLERINSSGKENKMNLDNKSSKSISENLLSVQQLITEIKEYLPQ